MRTLIGWISALFASAFIGAAVYGAVLSDPVPQADTDAVVERMVAQPGPQPTVVRTEVREVVEPTPTITVEDVVLVAPAQPAARQGTTGPNASRTAAPTSPQRSADDRNGRDDDRDEDAEDADHDDEDDSDSDSEDHEDDRDDHEDDSKDHDDD